MVEGFWPPQQPDSFDPTRDRKDADWDWQRMQDLENEHHENQKVLLPNCIDHLLPDALSQIESCLVSQRSDQIDDLRTMPYREFLKTEYWKRTRAAALEHWHNECAVCASRKNLEVHHRTYERRGREIAEDLIVLCRACHDIFHRNGRLSEPE